MIMYKILKYKVSCFNADYAVTGQREGLLLLCFMSFFMSPAETHCAFCCSSCWKVSPFQFSFLKCYGTLFTPWFLAYFFEVLSAISKGVQAHSIFLCFVYNYFRNIRLQNQRVWENCFSYEFALIVVRKVLLRVCVQHNEHVVNEIIVLF